MESYRLVRDARGTRVEVPYRGATLLHHPAFNKGTGFTAEERASFGLAGLLPEATNTIEQQARRVHANILWKEDPLERYIGLAALQDRNETLFYRLLVDHLEEFLPVVYTPTVGRACEEFSHIFRRARGLWITPAHRGRMHEVLGNAPFDDVRLIVVTDNERILGLGDQGAGGMGIPIGKLALYTAGAGIPPWQTLPVSLDVGTDNKTLLGDELYLGWRYPRLRGAEYDALVEEFVHAVRRRFPKALLQWEDFKKENAFRLLERYREALPSFNDDIQGTAAVTLAALVTSERITGRRFAEERIVMLGAGAAGIGISQLLRDAQTRAGLSGEALTRALAALDSRGLLVDGGAIRETYKRAFAWPASLAQAHGLAAGSSLIETVRALRPTVLVGTSGEPGAFPEDVVRQMAATVERPVILPLSNPTSKCEARPADLLAWTDGRALVATGSPFGDVDYGGRAHRIGQVNNAFVFPGVGLGALVAEARLVTDGMFRAAAKALAESVTAEDLGAGSLFPRVRELRAVSARVAEAVVREARDSGVGRFIADDAVAAVVAEAMWEPTYLPLVPA